MKPIAFTAMRAALSTSAAGPALREAKNRLLRLRYRGDDVECPLCGARFSEFYPITYPFFRRNARCLSCQSRERQRLVWLYLRDELKLGERGGRILHVAPEPCLRDRLRELQGVDLVTTDKNDPDVDVQADLTSLPFEDASFDGIVCLHVLDYVPDDRAAMRELRRVLKPGGWAVVQIPLDHARAETDEDPSLTDPAEQLRRFRLEGHVRVYGRDFFARMEQAGFDGVEIDYAAQLGDEKRKRFALPEDERVYRFTAPGAVTSVKPDVVVVVVTADASAASAHRAAAMRKQHPGALWWTTGTTSSSPPEARSASRGQGGDDDVVPAVQWRRVLPAVIGDVPRRLLRAADRAEARVSQPLRSQRQATVDARLFGDARAMPDDVVAPAALAARIAALRPRVVVVSDGELPIENGAGATLLRVRDGSAGALWHRDPGALCVEIDDGARVVARAWPTILRSDDLAMLRARAQRLATELLVDCLSSIAAGEPLPDLGPSRLVRSAPPSGWEHLVERDLSLGYLDVALRAQRSEQIW